MVNLCSSLLFNFFNLYIFFRKLKKKLKIKEIFFSHKTKEKRKGRKNMITESKLENGKTENEGFKAPPSNIFSLSTFWPVGPSK